MTTHKKREADGQTHHSPKSVEQQSEDSFPASDPPSFSGGKHIIGAPVARNSKGPHPDSHAVREAEKNARAQKGKKK